MSDKQAQMWTDALRAIEQVLWDMGTEGDPQSYMEARNIGYPDLFTKDHYQALLKAREACALMMIDSNWIRPTATT